MGSFSIAHWGIVLVIVMLLFGTKKLSGAGADLGKAVKGFKDGVKGEPEAEAKESHADTSVKATPALEKHQGDTAA